MRSTDIDSLSCTACAARLAAQVQLDVLPFPARWSAALRSARHARPLRGSVLQRLRAKRSARIHTPHAALFASASLSYSRGETACSTVVRTKSVAQPHQTSALERDHVEAARGHRAMMRQQKV